MSSYGIDLRALIRSYLMTKFRVPFNEADDITSEIIEQIEGADWIEVIGSRYHIQFERIWSKRIRR